MADRSNGVRAARARVGRGHLHYRVAGDGPPLVLVHGYSGACNWWRRNMSGLARRHTVFAVDLPGFGRNWPKHRFTIERAVADLVLWMDAMSLPRVDLCGHSMGGHICMRLAVAHPERVERLILADASGLPLGAGLPELAWRGFRSSGHTRFTFAPTVALSAAQAGPLVLWSALRDLRGDDVQPDLARIAAPTLLIWGQHDVLVPLEAGIALRRGIAGAQLAVVPGAGHNVMYECPVQFNRLVLDFLDAADCPYRAVADSGAAASWPSVRLKNSTTRAQ